MVLILKNRRPAKFLLILLIALYVFSFNASACAALPEEENMASAEPETSVEDFPLSSKIIIVSGFIIVAALMGHSIAAKRSKKDVF